MAMIKQTDVLKCDDMLFLLSVGEHTIIVQSVAHQMNNQSHPLSN